MAELPEGSRRRARALGEKETVIRLRIVNRRRGTVLATRAEVARESGSRRRGLLGPTRLAEGEGLWIVPCEAVHGFFMQFPIDVVFPDRKKRVVKVRPALKPRRTAGSPGAHSVAELPEGSRRRAQPFWENETVMRLRIVNRTRGTVLATRAEVARESGSRRRGLLGRTRLAEGEGLWIVPCEAVHCFFMKFPIDVVFLDRKKRVVKVRPALKPWRIAGSLRAHSVLELPEGTIHATGTQPGDELEFEEAGAN